MLLRRNSNLSILFSNWVSHIYTQIRRLPPYPYSHQFLDWLSNLFDSIHSNLNQVVLSSIMLLSLGWIQSNVYVLDYADNQPIEKLMWVGIRWQALCIIHHFLVSVGSVAHFLKLLSLPPTVYISFRRSVSLSVLFCVSLESEVGYFRQNSFL